MLLPSLILVYTILIFIHCSKDPVSTEPVSNDLEHVFPEVVGWSSSKLKAVEDFAEQIGSVAVMALYDGKVFFDWGETDRNFWCHSIRKPFLSALYGIHVAAGHLNLDATLKELGIDDIPPRLTEEEKQATVRDLLKSRSGVYHEAAAENQYMKDARPVRGSHPPGTFYYYNNWDFNTLGAIFEQQTGTKIFEEFNRKIAMPIGMQDFDIKNCYYEYELELSEHPAYCFRMSARDMARFGLMYLRHGSWNHKQIVPSQWIEESTTSYSLLDSAMGTGYGYLWAVVPDDPDYGKIFFHTGIGVHLLMVIPEEKLVFIHRMNTDIPFTDPGDAINELFRKIIEAKSNS
jgi:CubicO group peptidase (beta-lactamase class C family)